MRLFEKDSENAFFSCKCLNRKTNVTTVILKNIPMNGAMSVGFDNLQFVGQFVPPLVTEDTISP
jgi:hypothetical protein